MVNMFFVLLQFTQAKPKWRREHYRNLLSVSQNYFASSLVELAIFTIPGPIIFSTITHFLTKMNHSFYSFFVHCTGQILLSNAGVAFGYFVSSLVDTVEQANTIAGPMIFPFLTAGSILLKKVPNYLVYFKKFSLFYHGTKMISKGQWLRVGPMRCSLDGKIINSSDCHGLLQSIDGIDVLDYLGFNDGRPVWQDALWLIGISAVFRGLAWLTLLWKYRKSQK